MITEIAAIADAHGSVIDVGAGVAWTAPGTDGLVVRVDLATGAVDDHASLPVPVTGLAVTVDGRTLVVAGEDGVVRLLPTDTPDTITDLAAVGEPLGQIGLTTSASGAMHVVGVAPTSGRLVAVRLEDGLVRPGGVLPGITGVVARGTRVFAAAVGADGRGRVVESRAGATPALATDLLPTGRLTASGDGTRLAVAHPSLRRASVVDPAAGTIETVATDDVPGDVVELHLLDDGSVLVLTTVGLFRCDDLSDLAPRPVLAPPDQALFVGSWVPLRYDLAGTGLTPSDVTFVVPDGSVAGLVSHTTFSPALGGAPVPMLVAGGLLGQFRVDMQEVGSGTVLASAAFEVTDHWRDPDHGPSQMLVGESGPRPAGDWGGGPATPQNIATLPHTGTWRTAVLLVDTADGRYPGASLTQERTRILGEVQDGVTFSGTTRSARHYYEENSGWDPATNAGLTIAAHGDQVHGPVSLPDGWGSYFAQGKDAAGTVTDDRWTSLGATAQTIVTRAVNDGVLTTTDLSSIDVLVMVLFSPDTTSGTTTKRFVWPHASLGKVHFLAGPDVMTDQRSFAFTFVPRDFAVHDGRQVHTTLSHELGHTLGLPDLYAFPSYTPDVTGRLTGGWDMMAGSRDALPHFSLSNKMRMGWVRAEHVSTFNFAAGGVPSGKVTLHAAEFGTPPSGRKRGVELRLSDGWNLYAEYRAKQPGQVGDTLPVDQRVLITDVTSDGFATPISRAPVLLVHTDPDGDGPVLTTSGDFEDVDPGNQRTLTVTVGATDATSAEITVEYDSNGLPDPGLRPWQGAPAWQSPDIEVRNERAQADPAWFNTPWTGHQNTIVAKVTNHGDRDATAVTVSFFVVNYTTGDGPMVFLGNDTHDIAAGATVEFSTLWSPPSDQHACVIVRIPLYRDPTAANVVENDIFNNEARSNYTKFVSASASPSTRVGTPVELANPFDTSALVHAVVRQTHPFHRVYVEHRWMRVDGRSSVPVMLFDEALVGFPEEGAFGEGEVRKRTWSEPNRVSLEGWVVPPFAADCATPVLTGGVTIEVAAGVATEVRIDDARPGFVSGTVTTPDGPVDGGTVLVEIRETDLFGARTSETTVVHQGRFGVEWGSSALKGELEATAHFLGSFGAAAGESEPVLFRD
ncbi:CARDB domain-containing protein [Actinomycetospora sp. OC33-EN08]|uniref:CARDB domain-containing protein n=1 Tax=Actinomycetospora aurantiaca TaxID=3129233 RepID=A0ABU8MQJ0_9PSEU